MSEDDHETEHLLCHSLCQFCLLLVSPAWVGNLILSSLAFSVAKMFEYFLDQVITLIVTILKIENEE